MCCVHIAKCRPSCAFAKTTTTATATVTTVTTTVTTTTNTNNTNSSNSSNSNNNQQQATTGSNRQQQAATSSNKQEVPALSLGLFTSDRPLERVVGQLVQHRPEVSLEAAGLVELLHRRVDHGLHDSRATVRELLPLPVEMSCARGGAGGRRYVAACGCELQGKAVEGQGKAAEGQGKAAEGQGKAAEGQGKAADGQGKAAEVNHDRRAEHIEEGLDLVGVELVVAVRVLRPSPGGSVYCIPPSPPLLPRLPCLPRLCCPASLPCCPAYRPCCPCSSPLCPSSDAVESGDSTRAEDGAQEESPTLRSHCIAHDFDARCKPSLNVSMLSVG